MGAGGAKKRRMSSPHRATPRCVRLSRCKSEEAGQWSWGYMTRKNRGPAQCVPAGLLNIPDPSQVTRRAHCLPAPTAPTTLHSSAALKHLLLSLRAQADCPRYSPYQSLHRWSSRTMKRRGQLRWGVRCVWQTGHLLCKRLACCQLAATTYPLQHSSSWEPMHASLPMPPFFIFAAAATSWHASGSCAAQHEPVTIDGLST